METVICSCIVKQFLPLASSFCIHLSMIPFGSRGLSHSVWTEREVRATGRGGGWRAGGADEVWSSVTGPRLQHCLTVRTDRTEMCRHLSGWFRWTRGRYTPSTNHQTGAQSYGRTDEEKWRKVPPTSHYWLPSIFPWVKLHVPY